MADLVALGVLESYEAATEIGDGSAVINCVAGKSFSAGDSAIVFWGDSEAGVSGNYSASPVDLEGLVLGSPILLPVAPLSANTRYWYQVQITSGGTDTLGNVRFFDHDPATTRTVASSVYADSHHGSQRANSQSRALAMFRRGMSNISDFAKNSSLPHEIDDVGDNIWAFSNSINDFPVGPDFVKLNPTSRWALSQTDMDRMLRVLRIDSGEAHAYSQQLRAPGNHDAYFKELYAANNGATISAADYALQGYQSYLGNIGNNGAWQGDSEGRWGCKRFGPVLKCYVDPGLFTEFASTSPSSAIMPDHRGDTTVGQTVWDFFFDATTGVITTASPANTPFIAFYMHNGLGGAVGTSGFERYNFGTACNFKDKFDIGTDGVMEMGAGADWPNTYSYTGDYASLGFFGAAVNRCRANGCIPIIFMAHVHFGYKQVLDGVHVFGVQRFNSEGSNHYDWGHRSRFDIWTGTDWLDTQENSQFFHNGGHLRWIASPKSFSVFRVVTVDPDGSVLSPPDGIAINSTAVHLATISVPTQSRSIVRDTGDRTVEDSNTPEAAGSVQPSPKATEPYAATTMFGAHWQAFTQGGANEHIAVRASEIDAARVIRTLRPVTAGAAAIRQTICTPLYGLDREIRLKARMAGSAPTSTVAIIGICTQPENYLTTVSGKGLTMRFVGSGGSNNQCQIRWDGGITDANQATSSPDYKCPVDASFDGGFVIRMRGRRVQVWADISGTMTKIIDHALSEAIYSAIRADATMRCVGWGSGVNNITSQGRNTEVIDFSARYLPK